jgi:hypothetical protein
MYTFLTILELSNNRWISHEKLENKFKHALKFSLGEFSSSKVNSLLVFVSWVVSQNEQNISAFSNSITHINWSNKSNFFKNIMHTLINNSSSAPKVDSHKQRSMKSNLKQLNKHLNFLCNAIHHILSTLRRIFYSMLAFEQLWAVIFTLILWCKEVKTAVLVAEPLSAEIPIYHTGLRGARRFFSLSLVALASRAVWRGGDVKTPTDAELCQALFRRKTASRSLVKMSMLSCTIHDPDCHVTFDSNVPKTHFLTRGTKPDCDTLFSILECNENCALVRCACMQ